MSILERLDQVQSLDGRLTAVAPIPTSVKLETTTLCNHDCSYCSRQYRDRKHGVMSWKFFIRILEAYNVWLSRAHPQSYAAGMSD